MAPSARRTVLHCSPSSGRLAALDRFGQAGTNGGAAYSGESASFTAFIQLGRNGKRMDAIILAAGLGTRLRPHTLTTPKPLLPVRGRPILDWALGALPPAVDRVVVVIHYLPEQVTAYLQGQTHFARWETVLQEKPRGTGDAVRACRDRLHSEQLPGPQRRRPLRRRRPGPAGGLPRRPARSLRSRSRAASASPLSNRTAPSTAWWKSPTWTAGSWPTPGPIFFRATFSIRNSHLSPRGEYEITDYVTKAAARQAVQVVQARFWLPIGTVEAWHNAQEQELENVLTAKR